MLLKKLSKQKHYDNSKGSIYKVCDEKDCNAWETDIIKRVIRCRKKGTFREDLEKTKDLIDLYLFEYAETIEDEERKKRKRKKKLKKNLRV